MSKKFDPDRLLAAEQIPDLNRQFYRSRPYSYFHQRLCGLLLVACEPESVRNAVGGSLAIGELTIKLGELRPEDEGAIDYAALESVVLLHHSAEALFRLYFAHSGGPACPWLEASRVSFGDAFKTGVKKLLDTMYDDEDVRADVLKAFRGQDSYEASAVGGFTGNRSPVARTCGRLV